MYNGKVEGIFEDEGSFDIESDIIPFLSTLKGFKFGFNSGIRAEVLFINTKEFTVKWGTKNAINIPALCRAMGVKNVHEVNAFDLPLLEKTIKEETAKDEVSVIITKTPCVLLDKRKKPLYIAHEDKCKKCGMCMKPGCPAMTKNADGTIHIDDTMCTGCGLCESLCKFGAIELVKEGE